MATQTCSLAECTSLVRTAGLCNAHYQRRLKHGDPRSGGPRIYADPATTFAARTERDGDCIVWTGRRDHRGYGRLTVRGRSTPAHRYSWESERGEVPAGMELDHTCWNRACVSPEHLRLASRAQNVQNMSGPRSDNRSGYRGVSRDGNKWVARVTVGGVEHAQYGFGTPEEAARAAAALRAELFGEFAGRG